jgi:hypothetical protein
MHARPLAVMVAATLVGCAASQVRPTGAGSTAVLRLMRDWRGVWSGQVKDSPMGALSYTVYVEEAPGAKIRLRMALQREADLETMRHLYELSNFHSGTPVIHYALAQRSSRQEGEVAYREELSSDEEAVFCTDEGGCDKLKVAVVMLSATKVHLRTMLREAPHATIELQFASGEVPKDSLEEPPKATLKRTRMKSESREAQDGRREGLDFDLGESDSVEANKSKRKQ